MAKFNVSSQARQDLDDIWEYIARDNPHAANRVEDDILAAFYQLTENPKIGHLRQDLTNKPVRFWNVYSYLIIYKAESKPIEIVRILSASRDIPSIL